jgi:hypothetical protein
VPPTPTALLEPSAIISPENIKQLVELGRLRGGKPPSLWWSKDGEILAVSFPDTIQHSM